MLYDIKKDDPVARKLANGSTVTKEEKKEIENYIKNNIDKKRAKKLSNSKEEAHGPLVKIGMARINKFSKDIEFEERKYTIEGGYKYAPGYEIR